MDVGIQYHQHLQGALLPMGRIAEGTAFSWYRVPALLNGWEPLSDESKRWTL